MDLLVWKCYSLLQIYHINTTEYWTHLYWSTQIPHGTQLSPSHMDVWYPHLTCVSPTTHGIPTTHGYPPPGCISPTTDVYPPPRMYIPHHTWIYPTTQWYFHSHMILGYHNHGTFSHKYTEAIFQQSLLKAFIINSCCIYKWLLVQPACGLEIACCRSYHFLTSLGKLSLQQAVHISLQEHAGCPCDHSANGTEHKVGNVKDQPNTNSCPVWSAYISLCVKKATRCGRMQVDWKEYIHMYSPVSLFEWHHS